MSEKFRKVVRAPEQLAGTLRKKIEGTHPIDYIQGRAKDGKLNAGDVAAIVALGGVRATGWLAAGGSQFLLWLVRAGLLDNATMRFMEKKLGKQKVKKNDAQPSKFAQFTRANPNLTSHVLYYFMLASLISGGALAAYLNRDKLQEAKKAVTEKLTPRSKGHTSQSEKVTINYGALAELDGGAHEVVERYWPYLAVAVTEFETYRDAPKTQSGESRATRGPGLTYHYYESEKTGKLARENLTEKHDVLDRNANYMQCKWHMEYDTIPKIITNKGKTNLTVEQVLGLAISGYQRPADTYGIIQRLKTAKNGKGVVAAFADVSNVPKNFRNGTRKRRWWCAAIACGAITMDQILDMDRDAFSRIGLSAICHKDGTFKMDAATVNYALEHAKNAKKGTCRAFLGSFDEGRNVLKNFGQVPSPLAQTVDITLQTDVSASESESVQLLTQAEAAYRQGKYNDAVTQYQQAIKKDATNLEAYSGLALTYKKLGDNSRKAKQNDQALVYYAKACQEVRNCNTQMNRDDEILYDIKAASYFNAAVSREAMGDIYQAQGDNAKAIRNYDLAVKNLVTAIKNATEANKYSNEYPNRVGTYTEKKGEVTQKMSSLQPKQKSVTKSKVKAKSGKKTSGKKVNKKRTAFNMGMRNIEQSQRTADLLIYGTEHKGNMA